MLSCAFFFAPPSSIPLMLGNAEAFTQRPHSLPFGF